MPRFTSRLLLSSALLGVPACALVAAPGPAMATSQANVITLPSSQTKAAKSTKSVRSLPKPRKTRYVDTKQLRTGKSGTSVKTYQARIRIFAREVGINYRKINKSGATGYYGTETRELTRAVTGHVALANRKFRSGLKSRVHPSKAFLAFVGLKPQPKVKAPASYVANSAWPAIVTATPNSKPSTWKGPALKHPRTKKVFAYNVSRWANIVRSVMREHGVADKYLVGILAQIQQESGGNPTVVNNWDSNAKRGTPSKGLLQVILPTYQYYAKKGYTAAKYQTVAYTNIWAALNYVKGRYGMSKFASWNSGQNQGY